MHLSAGSLAKRLQRSQVGGNLTMCWDRLARWRKERLPIVFCCLSLLQFIEMAKKKPAIRWSFEMGIGVESDKKLFDFIFRIGEGFGIADRYNQPKIARFKATNSMKDFQVTANCPKGRKFEIDSQEQWDVAIAKVITKERELTGGRLPKSGLYLDILNARSKKLFIYDHSLITFVLSDNSDLHFFFIRIYTKLSFP